MTRRCVRNPRHDAEPCTRVRPYHEQAYRTAHGNGQCDHDYRQFEAWGGSKRRDLLAIQVRALVEAEDQLLLVRVVLARSRDYPVFEPGVSLGNTEEYCSTCNVTQEGTRCAHVTPENEDQAPEPELSGRTSASGFLHAAERMATINRPQLIIQ